MSTPRPPSDRIERDTADPRIEYHGFQEPTPSEAWGRFLHYEWWLYARGASWDFTLVFDPQIELFALDLRGCPPEELPRGVFFREAVYRPGDRFGAGYMSEAEKRAIVRQCVAEFEREHLNRDSER